MQLNSKFYIAAMPSESLALPSINKVSAQLSGKSFLAASHYRVGHDRRLSKSATKRSLFKKDYVAHSRYGRADAAIPPSPAEVMHRDISLNGTDATETQQQYQGKALPKVNQCKALTKTNFKMDADDRIDSFQTSHSKEFAPVHVLSRSFPMTEPMKSFVPQGDPLKELMPSSDYRSKYLGHDTKVHKITRAPCMHAGGPPTIKGDNRTHEQFSTSASDQFPGRYLPYIAVKPDLLGSSIPTGDQDKVIQRETTQLTSYMTPGSESYKRYARDDAVLRIRNTNFKMGHNPSKYDKFETNAMEAFQPREHTKPIVKVVKDSNASSFPEGDRDPLRVKVRVSTTNYDTYHQNPPSDFRNPIISGANKRTASQVVLGEPSKSRDFYQTTQADSFIPIRVPTERASGHPESKVPLDYYSGGQYTTTTLSEYPNWKDAQHHFISIDALNKLRKSNFSPPLHGSRFFDTTHLTSYTAKKAPKHQYDSGKLQRSSVPLGTMTI